MADWVEGYYDVLPITMKPAIGVLNVTAVSKVKLPPCAEIGPSPVFVDGKLKGSIPIKTIRFYPESDDG